MKTMKSLLGFGGRLTGGKVPVSIESLQQANNWLKQPIDVAGKAILAHFNNYPVEIRMAALRAISGAFDDGNKDVAVKVLLIAEAIDRAESDRKMQQTKAADAAKRLAETKPAKKSAKKPAKKPATATTATKPAATAV